MVMLCKCPESEFAALRDELKTVQTIVRPVLRSRLFHFNSSALHTLLRHHVGTCGFFHEHVTDHVSYCDTELGQYNVKFLNYQKEEVERRKAGRIKADQAPYLAFLNCLQICRLFGRCKQAEKLSRLTPTVLEAATCGKFAI